MITYLLFLLVGFITNMKGYEGRVIVAALLTIIILASIIKIIYIKTNEQEDENNE